MGVSYTHTPFDNLHEFHTVESVLCTVPRGLCLGCHLVLSDTSQELLMDAWRINDVQNV